MRESWFRSMSDEPHRTHNTTNNDINIHRTTRSLQSTTSSSRRSFLWNTTMQADWVLAQTLTCDGLGVRCATAVTTTTAARNEEDGSSGIKNPDVYRLVTGTQGGSLIEYALPSGNLQQLPFQHDHAVTSLVSGPSKDDDDGNSNATQWYATGCKDSIVRVFDASSHAVVATLRGHEKPVTSLCWIRGNDAKTTTYLVSGSWDGTAKVWNVETSAMIATLGGHENSVCVTNAAAAASKDSTTTTTTCLTIATGSAGQAAGNVVSGHTTRLWTVDPTTGDTKLLHTVANDHDGPIRDICSTPDGASMVTCSNDGTVKVRTGHTGAVECTLVFVQEQHPPMLLSVAAGDDFIVAGAEDGHVVVWDRESSTQPQILRHAECVWNVTTLSDGSFVTCCQDGNVRIFTRDTERMAPLEERERFEREVQEALAKTRNGPSPEDVAKLPHWERNNEKRGTSEGQVQLFQKAGVAIAAQWSAASQTWIEVGQVTGQSEEAGMVDGLQYDHVFPIEVDQTGGAVARLEIGYNTGENTFSAAQRFIDAHQLPQHHLSEIADYISQRAGSGPANMLGATTGGVAAAPAASGSGMPLASYNHVPMKTYKAFELSEKSAQSMLTKMKEKMQEFGATDSAVMEQISSVMDTLVATNRYHASKVTDNELTAVSKLLKGFSPVEAFPALDLARLVVLHPDASASNRTFYWDSLFKQAAALCMLDKETLQVPSAVAIPMLSLRLFGNALKGGLGSRAAAIQQLSLILDCAEKCVTSANKNIRLSVSTLLFNLSFFQHQEATPFSKAVMTRIINLLNEIISAKAYETEAIYRALVALGSLLLDAPGVAKPIALALQLVSKVEPAASPHTAPVKEVAKEIYSLLQ